MNRQRIESLALNVAGGIMGSWTIHLAKHIYFSVAKHLVVHVVFK